MPSTAPLADNQQALISRKTSVRVTNPSVQGALGNISAEQTRRKSAYEQRNGVRDETQTHTHMCYCEFNDIIESIAALYADVITIETSRSDMELLEVFDRFSYPNEIGPGVYDIHSPNIPSQRHMLNLMKKAAEQIPAERLWVNPDCGLKTRQWSEVIPALANMVGIAKVLRGNKSEVI